MDGPILGSGINHIEDPLRPTILLTERDPPLLHESKVRFYKFPMQLRENHDKDTVPRPKPEHRRPSPYERPPVQDKLKRKDRDFKIKKSSSVKIKNIDSVDGEFALMALGTLYGRKTSCEENKFKIVPGSDNNEIKIEDDKKD